ncbi:MAG: TetR/AcrR family transcriptional regulator [Pseudomonadota bacterium]|nr:TetR/AcrR family transcriptional regulator [Pseudomonadota bacterium]
MRSGMRDEIARLKRERILEAARQLFFERGYQGTTLDQVAKQLEVTKPFIYSHFENKAELLGAICERGTRASLETVTAASERDGAPIERLIWTIREFVLLMTRYQANVAVYFREDKYLPKAVSTRIDTMRAEIDQRLGDLIREGVAAGQFHVSDIRLATLALGGMVWWMFTWYRQSGRLSDERLADLMVEHGLQMLGASAGGMAAAAAD